MSWIDPIATALLGTFEVDAPIRIPLGSLHRTLQRLQQPNFGRLPIYDLAALVTSQLSAAYHGAFLFETAGISYRDTYLSTRIPEPKYTFFRALLEDGIIVNLVNAKVVLTSDHVDEILTMATRDRIREIFDAEFPRLVDARDSTIHEHDRGIGRVKQQIIADSGQAARYNTTGIADLIDQAGQSFDIDFSPTRILRTIESIGAIFPY